ncbi:MAG TPA: MXAN_6640 family putative metalloprotease [Marmoricola sp.]|nr:MXAN_6640 family putative metalloprotease [Marmoricola sp.]
MRFPRPIMLFLSALLPLVFLPAGSTAVPRDVAPARVADTPGAATAEETLAAVQAAFAGGTPHGRRQAATGREVTLLLAQLRRRLDDLGPHDRRVAQSFLARPTSGGDPNVRYSRRARVTNDCRISRTKGSKVCVHWARNTHHAPPKGDRDRDRLPNQVEKVRNVANAVWGRVVTRGGYRRPPRDHAGPNGKLDLYLANIGAWGLYGYCVTEDRVSGRAYTGYCVLDDDYSRREFGANTPNQNLRVTVAHEFFHAVQFGYDAFEESWFMEGSAAWMEDELYDAVNDNHIYLPTSPLAHPDLPLDRVSGLSVYGSWIFWRFLTERYDDEGRSGLPRLMRRLWRDADHLNRTKPRRQAIGALRNELSHRGVTLPEVYADFSVANRRPAAFYEEGATYARYVDGPSLRTLRAETPGVAGSARVNHLASETIRFLPGDSGKGPDLELAEGAAPLPSSAAVRIAVAPVVGGVRFETVTADGAGGWNASVPGFDAATTRYVELTLVNGAADGVTSLAYSADVVPQPS